MKSLDTIFTQHSKNSLIFRLEDALGAAQKMRVDTPCWTCKNFRHNDASCQLANASIPVEVQEVGCEAYNFDPDSAPF